MSVKSTVASTRSTDDGVLTIVAGEELLHRVDEEVGVLGEPARVEVAIELEVPLQVRQMRGEVPAEPRPARSGRRVQCTTSAGACTDGQRGPDVDLADRCRRMCAACCGVAV